MNVVSIQVSSRSLQEPPVPAFIVGHEGLDLVVLPLVSNQHPFNSRHLTDTDTQQLESHLHPLNANLPGAFYIYRSHNSLVLHCRWKSTPSALIRKGILCIEAAIFTIQAQFNANGVLILFLTVWQTPSAEPAAFSYSVLSAICNYILTRLSNPDSKKVMTVEKWHVVCFLTVWKHTYIKTLSYSRTLLFQNPSC